MTDTENPKMFCDIHGHTGAVLIKDRYMVCEKCWNEKADKALRKAHAESGGEEIPFKGVAVDAETLQADAKSYL
jgi:hypothetical protein